VLAYKRVVLIITRLWYQYDWDWSRSVAFQSSRICGGSLRPFGIIEVPRRPFQMLFNGSPIPPIGAAYLEHVPWTSSPKSTSPSRTTSEPRHEQLRGVCDAAEALKYRQTTFASLLCILSRTPQGEIMCVSKWAYEAGEGRLLYQRGTETHGRCHTDSVGLTGEWSAVRTIPFHPPDFQSKPRAASPQAIDHGQ